jgi:glycosyltransferase involved in cell wall biosynthesis
MSFDHASFIREYDAPVADPGAPRPRPRFARRGEGATRRLLGRVVHRGRRLAYVDTHFPWRRSGFRYDEALALHELRPDTLFFSLWAMTDPFPARVHALADFPRRATTGGVTDVYAVFLDCAAGLLGEPLDGMAPSDPVPTVPPNLSSVFERSNMRLHVGLYPGGGLTLSPPRLAQARCVAERASSVWSWVPQVQELPNVHAVPPAVINPRLYRAVDREWDARPLRVVFAGDSSQRKGIDVALDAFDALDDRFAFEVVGPHEHHREVLAHPERVTFHGWLGPERLRALFERSHVFVSPVRTEPDGLGGEMVDGFPTTTAGSAMASGCLLVTSNPARDHTVLTPGLTHVELAEATPEALVTALDWAATRRPIARRTAEAGQRTVRERLDVFAAMRGRLDVLGLSGPTRF